MTTSPENNTETGEKATASRGLYTVTGQHASLTCDTLYQAARTARTWAQHGIDTQVTGPEGFAERLYLPRMAGNARWHYVVQCVCGRRMYPGSQCCRQCWTPSERHLEAFRKNVRKQ